MKNSLYSIRDDNVTKTISKHCYYVWFIFFINVNEYMIIFEYIVAKDNDSILTQLTF